MDVEDTLTFAALSMISVQTNTPKQDCSLYVVMAMDAGIQIRAVQTATTAQEQ